MEEVVDHAVDVHKSSDSYFDEQKDLISFASKVVRPLGILAHIFGWYCLFAPVIALLSWIPLVGYLLGGVVAIAAGIFAFVVGLVISLLTIAIAWVFYRPLIGIVLF